MKTIQYVNEGFVSFRGYKVWYRIVGKNEDTRKLPLLCLHGGPGAAHDYLEPLEAIAETGRQIIFYDQLGCGKSDQPHDPSLWTLNLFLEELATIREKLGLEHLYIIGQSWGGMLAMEHALTQAPGIKGLILASAPASIPQWVAEANRLRSELTSDIQETLLRHEQDGTTNAPAYTDAMMVFYRKYVCRMETWPDCLNRTLEQMERNPEVYHTMFGPSEFYVTGNLKNWDISDRLGEIRIPTLITSGRYDECTPAIAETVHKGIRNSKWVIFENSGHEAHIEESKRYFRVLNEFLCDLKTQK